MADISDDSGLDRNLLRKVRSSPQMSNTGNREIPQRSFQKSASANDIAEFYQLHGDIARATPFLAWPGISERVQYLKKLRLEERSEGEQTLDLEELVLGKDKYTLALVGAILHGVVGAFLYGYNITCLNTVQTTLQNDCCGRHIDKTEFGIISSMYMVGGFLGAMIGGRLSDRFGRKRFLLGTDVIAIIGAGMFYFVSYINNYKVFLATRFVLGFGGGGTTAAIPTYLGEISPASKRGAIGTLYQLTVTVGCLGGYLVSEPLKNSWGFIGAANLVLPVLQILTVCFFPESPVWLYSRYKDERAIQILTKLRGYRDIRFELSTYTRVRKKTVNDDQGQVLLQPEDSNPKRSLCGTRSVRKALIISCALAAVQQFSGINAVMQYSGDMFSTAGFPKLFLANVLVGAVNVFGVVITVPLMDRLGRRVLLLLSALIMLAACIMLSWTRTRAEKNKNPWGMVTVIISLVYVLGFEFGMGPIPWLIVAEICPTSHRAQIMSLAAGINWFANLIVSFGYNPVAKAVKNYVWYIFAGVLLLGGVFVATTVPETKGKLPDEIEALLAGRKKKKTADEILQASKPVGNHNQPKSYVNAV